MYPTLVRDLENKLTSKEWNLVSHYIYKAADYGEDNAAGKIQYYLRFY